jgi:hypothetical protein
MATRNAIYFGGFSQQMECIGPALKQMRRTLVILIFAKVTLAGFMLENSFARQETNEGFRVVRERYETPEGGEIWGAAVVAGTNKFSFVPPSNWLLESNMREKKVTFTRRDFSATMNLKIWETNFVPTVWKEMALQQFPGAKLTGEFECFTANEKGMAFDLERSLPKRAKLTSRVAYVPYAGGLIEFQMTTTPDVFRRYHAVFGHLLNSFRVDAYTTMNAPAVKPLATAVRPKNS